SHPTSSRLSTTLPSTPRNSPQWRRHKTSGDSPSASTTNCDNEPLDPADRSYVITPEGSAYYLRQPSALAYTDATQPTARVPEAYERPFVGPLNEIKGSRAQDADEIEDYIATICYSIDIHDAAITEAQPSRRR
ncbi:hypothetical protein, partial [Mycolicibacterium hodleri]|uniref:hypothetical protein n=1 Tax=Mycolicibacterium hodleri TaxID=49897 RepID=UPI0021F296EB